MNLVCNSAIFPLKVSDSDDDEPLARNLTANTDSSDDVRRFSINMIAFAGSYYL